MIVQSSIFGTETGFCKFDRVGSAFDLLFSVVMVLPKLSFTGFGS
jgi:hypothetical protein